MALAKHEKGLIDSDPDLLKSIGIAWDGICQRWSEPRPAPFLFPMEHTFGQCYQTIDFKLNRQHVANFKRRLPASLTLHDEFWGEALCTALSGLVLRHLAKEAVGLMGILSDARQHGTGSDGSLQQFGPLTGCTPACVRSEEGSSFLDVFCDMALHLDLGRRGAHLPFPCVSKLYDGQTFPTQLQFLRQETTATLAVPELSMTTATFLGGSCDEALLGTECKVTSADFGWSGGSSRPGCSVMIRFWERADSVNHISGTIRHSLKSFGQDEAHAFVDMLQCCLREVSQEPSILLDRLSMTTEARQLT